MKSVSWIAPSNIAFVKYWGKKEGQIPLNPSVSMTLKNATTKTKLSWRLREPSEFNGDPSDLGIEFLFEGKENLRFQQRIYRLFLQLLKELPFLKEYHFTIESENNFPHSTGIASSASSMASLALCLTSFLEEEGRLDGDFFNKSSYLARLGSGSASRSIFGGFSLWGEVDGIAQTTDEYALSFEDHLRREIHPQLKGMKDSILIVSSQSKKVSSREGHREMDHHFFRESRRMMALHNLREILKIFSSGDFERFSEIVESEAYALHSMMMTSPHPFCLFHPNTIQIIEIIKKGRVERGLPICFTLDAGPNVHLLYPRVDEFRVKEFILYELKHFCENETIYWDEEGTGPYKVVQTELT